MRASKCYAVEIIQCMARSDIYEGRYDFYLDGVLCVWIWSVPRDQEPIYQPDSWRCVRWGTSAIPCSHSKTLNIYWHWYWQSREMHQLRIKEVDDNEVWFQTLSSGHPEATCFHRLNGESRKSTKFLPPFPTATESLFLSPYFCHCQANRQLSWIAGFVFVWFHSIQGIFQFATFITDIVTVKGQNSFLTSSFILS